ncbi:3'-5' exoribonuclease YhaM family protein [Limnoglobus roseus]|uniref:HD domain-containing protein n=1 Tax=Limnoglobus roseus TaxID=2598579 RepID=A0A5C1A8Q6_9BACT|nr:OB-fold nucleic acid binding domain-containing protein [Limnoglobus roseus]QEL14573.1 HD domain-containing protein [Limnoglobus roseus]
MTRRYVEQLRDGDSLDDVYLVTDKQLRANRNGNLYVQMELRDRTGGMSARMWNAGDAVYRSFDNGDFVHADGKVQNFQGSLQIVLNHIEKVEHQKIDLHDFMPHTEHNVGKLLERLRDYLMRLNSPHLRALAECFLIDDPFMRNFSACPAGVKLHHAYVGGLLEHTVTMMDIADRLVAFYPGTDRDLLMMGVFLHDAGKTKELSYARTFGYTDEGQLVGHITIGVEMLNEMMPRVEELTGEAFPRELLIRLKHMILSHHGTLEYGSPKIPMTPEAMLLHSIDMMDTRMHMVLRDLREDRNNQTAWTPFNVTLQRRFYKGGPNGDLYADTRDSYD